MLQIKNFGCGCWLVLCNIVDNDTSMSCITRIWPLQNSFMFVGLNMWEDMLIFFLILFRSLYIKEKLKLDYRNCYSASQPQHFLVVSRREGLDILGL